MASVKIVLRKKQNKDGTYPLAVRITKDRKSSYVHTGHHVIENFWDAKNRKIKKSHPNSIRLNNLLSKKLAEAEDSLLDLEVQKADVSSKVVKSKLRASKATSFFAQAELYLADLKKQGKYNRRKSDKSRIKAFKDFLNDSDISFKEITESLLTKYRAYLKGSRKVGEQTTVNYLTVIQTIFNLAISNGIVEQKYYPFGRGKVKLKAPKSLKIGLSNDEVKQLEELSLPEDSYLHHARNIWLIAFYFAGMRVSDVLRLKWADFQNDRLYYSMGKNEKPGSLKVPEKALGILSQYSGKNYAHNLVFPDLQELPDLTDTYNVQRRISGVIQKLDEALKDVAKKAKITKKLTMHIARHTFGNISGDKIPIQMLQKLYRHTSITTTIGYQANFIHKDTDEALDAVITF
jgi:integrase/recombinase XerD